MTKIFLEKFRIFDEIIQPYSLGLVVLPISQGCDVISRNILHTKAFCNCKLLHKYKYLLVFFQREGTT